VYAKFGDDRSRNEKALADRKSDNNNNRNNNNKKNNVGCGALKTDENWHGFCIGAV